MDEGKTTTKQEPPIDNDLMIIYIYIYIYALSQILSTIQIISNLVCHKPTKWDSDNQHGYDIYIYIYVCVCLYACVYMCVYVCVCVVWIVVI